MLHAHNSIKEDGDQARKPDEVAAIERWLAMIRDSNAPPQDLCLKPGCICALMRNLSLELGLVKNVRVVVQSIAKHSVTVHTIKNGAADQRTHVLPRINFKFQPMWSFYVVFLHRLPEAVPPTSGLCYHVQQLSRPHNRQSRPGHGDTAFRTWAASHSAVQGPMIIRHGNSKPANA